MAGGVVFDPVAFVARYPEFAAVSPTLLADYFTEATLYCNNTATTRVQDLATLTLLLNMLTAHIAKLNSPNASGLVGRIDQASEGSVSAHATYSSAVAGSMAWFIQTSYGAAYWQATKPYRSFRYRAPARVC